MASLEQKIEAENDVRELLKQNGMPQPDGVEYGYGCIRLFFDEPRVVLVVDIDRPEDGYRPATDDAEDRYRTVVGEANDDFDDNSDDFDYGYPFPRDKADDPDDLRADLN